MKTLVAVGDRCPKLQLTRAGRPFVLPTPPRGTILYFMRTADCPVCRAHVRRLAQLFPDFERAGFSVVVVVPNGGDEASVESHLRLPFPVVSGHDAHANLGLGRFLFGAIQQSGTVVLDAEGFILRLTRATVPSSAFPEDEVLDLVRPPAAA